MQVLMQEGTRVQVKNIIGFHRFPAGTVGVIEEVDYYPTIAPYKIRSDQELGIDPQWVPLEEVEEYGAN